MLRAFFRGLSLRVPEKVYEPREDTSLLADCMDVEPGDRVLEVGCGSGALSLVAAGEGAEVVGVDVSEEAVEASKGNAEENGVEAEFRHSDLFDNVSDRFDVVIFNPPYLPVEDDLPGAGTWSGGSTGREVIERFAEGLPGHLHGDGEALIVISSATGLERTREIFDGEGFETEIVGEEKVPWETLYCLRLAKM